MQISKLTPSVYSNCRSNNIYADKSDLFLKREITFKGGLDKELSAALKNVAKNSELKDIFANPKKKETFMGLLVSALATITTMLCDKNDDNGDVFVKQTTSDSDIVASEKVAEIPNEEVVEQEPCTTEEVLSFMTEKSLKELEVLKKLMLIKQNDVVCDSYVYNEQKKYKGNDEEFEAEMLEKLDKIQNELVSEKPNQKIINQFIKDLSTSAGKEKQNYTASPEIKENFNETVSWIIDSYAEKVSKKFSAKNSKKITIQNVKEAITLAIEGEESIEEEKLKELPKTHGKHTEIEYNLIRFMEPHKENISLYNKFVDAYTKYCGFNRNGISVFNGVEKFNSEISK